MQEDLVFPHEMVAVLLHNSATSVYTCSDASKAKPTRPKGYWGTLPLGLYKGGIKGQEFT